MPTLLIVAEEGFRHHQEAVENALAHIDDLVLEQVAGGHHFHMEPGVETVAARIGRFLHG